jgi:hypothetical protein
MANDETVPTVAICAIVRDEASYVEEWVEFHRRQRVTAFRIYDNGSIDGTPDVLRGLGIEPAIWAAAGGSRSPAAASLCRRRHDARQQG